MAITKDYKRDFGGEIKVKDDEYSASDDCQTPPYALAALADYLLGQYHVAWEPATGKGYLADAIPEWLGLGVVKSGLAENFFTYEPNYYDIQITNPPWSKKYQWLERSIKLERPFALLLPSKILFASRAIKLIEDHNLEIIQVYPRIAYKMPSQTSFLQSQPQLDSCWLTSGLYIGRRLTYRHIGKEKSRFMRDLKAKESGQLRLI